MTFWKNKNAAKYPNSEWPLELSERMQSFADWEEFYRSHSYINDPMYIEMLVDLVRQNGYYCPGLHQDVQADLIVFGAPNYREGLYYGGLNSRLRAVLLELHRCFSERPEGELRIYAPEATTTFAKLMRGRYIRFIGSEYSDDPQVIDSLFPIQRENLMDLSFPDAVFDAVIVNDVFEHVPEIDKCLLEIARVTRPGGRLITTFPFNIGAETSVHKARWGDRGIEYLMEPEYHGNPVDPKGSLVFEIPGWNILERARNCGWQKVEMVYETSVNYGVVGGGFSGIFNFVAKRN